MNPEEVTADPAALGNYLAGLPRPQHTHGGPSETTREDYYKDHRIVIRTTYEITVDGNPLDVPVSLSNDGSAHCHGLPTYQFGSVVDMVRALIEYFPDDFPPGGDPSTDDTGGHGGHGIHSTGGS